MSHIFGTEVDFNSNEAKKFRIENNLSFPTVGASDSGRIVLNTGLNGFYGWNGTSWIGLGASGGGSYTLPTASTTVLGGVKTDGTTITIDGGGVITANYPTAAIIAENQGNGIGYFIYNREPTKYSPIGLGSVDLTVTPITEPLTTYGVESPGGFSTGTSNRLPSGASNYGSHQAHGYGNVVSGYYNNMAFGTYNTMSQGYSNFCAGYGNTVNTSHLTPASAVIGTHNNQTGYLGVTVGAGLINKWKGATITGMCNVDNTATVIQADRPAFVVGIGDMSVLSSSYGNANSRKDGLVVKFNGEVVLPETTIAIINAEATGRTLVTKEWIQAGYTVATLPTGVIGKRTYVTDSTVVASGNFGATVIGGGANTVPLFYDGTNWIIA